MIRGIAAPTFAFARRTRSGFLGSEGLLIIVLCAALAAPLFAALRNGADADTWLAIEAGQLITTHGLPHVDKLTVWGSGHRWVDQQWLAQLIFGRLYGGGGLRLIAIVCALAAGAAVATAAVLARRRGATTRATTLVAALALVSFTLGAVTPRPQSLAYLPFVLVVALISGDAARPSPRVLLTLPILAVWANLHGSVALAAALVAAHGLLVLRARPRVGMALIVAPWLCLCASPYALELPSYYRQMLGDPSFAPYASEWQPTSFSPLTLAFFLLAAAALYLAAKNPGVLRRSEASILILTAVAGLLAVRNIVWFALAALVLLPPLLDRVLTQRASRPALNRKLALAATTLTLVLFVGVGLDQQLGEHAYPPAAADAAAAAAGTSARVFTTEKYADWLLLRDPALAGRIAFDARLELFPAGRIQAHAIALSNGAGWRDLTRGYRVLMLDRGADHQLVRRLTGHGARRIYDDGRVVVLTRSSY